MAQCAVKCVQLIVQHVTTLGIVLNAFRVNTVKRVKMVTARLPRVYVVMARIITQLIKAQTLMSAGLVLKIVLLARVRLTARRVNRAAGENTVSIIVPDVRVIAMIRDVSLAQVATTELRHLRVTSAKNVLTIVNNVTMIQRVTNVMTDTWMILVNVTRKISQATVQTVVKMKTVIQMVTYALTAA